MGDWRHSCALPTEKSPDLDQLERIHVVVVFTWDERTDPYLV